MKVEFWTIKCMYRPRRGWPQRVLRSFERWLSPLLGGNYAGLLARGLNTEHSNAPVFAFHQNRGVSQIGGTTPGMCAILSNNTMQKLVRGIVRMEDPVDVPAQNGPMRCLEKPMPCSTVGAWRRVCWRMKTECGATEIINSSMQISNRTSNTPDRFSRGEKAAKPRHR